MLALVELPGKCRSQSDGIVATVSFIVTLALRARTLRARITISAPLWGLRPPCAVVWYERQKYQTREFLLFHPVRESLDNLERVLKEISDIIFRDLRFSQIRLIISAFVFAITLPLK